MHLSNPEDFLAATIFLVFIAPINSQDSPEDFLAAHNEARASVRVALYATTYANQRRGDCALKNSEGPNGEPGPYGENLAWNSGSMSAAEAVEAWVNQKSDYDYNSNTCADPLTNCLSYTQVVWRNSVKLGCAKVSCINDGGTYITCNYDPAGNIVGQWPY
ncbi:hypothetical protein F2Q68_00008163 [Brassica cretica]|uniref:SCP domain-containing protein n=1 Tax=Brassica cretica TaxID=69181 RepID=A0A8S9KSM2_BRACR|nr:hypothetical protein F2Q68_00008163 [Brassica cretica]